MTAINLTFFEDPGHGWLEVPKKILSELGIISRISTCSYENGVMAYLEEDCDYGLFVEAARANRLEFKIDTVYQENTPIRNYKGYWDA